ncbi:HET-domain-containing protein [Dendrothele bispora CBS 962.96]|uniref:HET-domain-containing protein n=1 Tax=Dendrothele bispora (strain CBS 962.96) TaxID=1314807 RepID=A0A4S8LLW9_DENBC|nr:HET-domain-containing protein [Dendrothele bispora CBS 962.96]
MTTYEYEALSTQQWQIRVLTILPGDFSDETRISLRNELLVGKEEDEREDADYVDEENSESGSEDDEMDQDSTEDDSNSDSDSDKCLEDDDDKGPHGGYAFIYEALSYVWGASNNPKTVIVELASPTNNIISITENLDVAMRHLRHKTEPRVMWIDAICINQTDDVEKSHQVGLMGYIYRLAAKVTVWLGPEENDSSYALDLLNNLGSKVEVDWIADSATPSEAGKSEPHWADITRELDYEERELKAVYFLLGRSWFGRLWVRQEIFLATEATLSCGYMLIPWKNFEKALWCLKSKPWTGRFLGEYRGKYRRLLDLAYGLCTSSYRSETYQSLRFTLRGVNWTNPKDAIYAVAALIHYDDHILDVKPDYTKPTSTIFKDVVLRIVERQKSLGFLGSCEISTRSLPELPSWVPDWSTQMKAKTGFTTPWSACGWISAEASYVGDGVLRAAGVCVSGIEQVYALSIDEENFDQHVLLSCIKKLSPQQNLENSYIGGGSVLEGHCRALFGDQGTTLLPIERAKEVLRSIWSSEKTLDITEKNIALKLFCNDCFENFIGRCFFSTTKGYIGLAPAGAQVGDVVSILLGSKYPLLLRETSADPSRWQVIGACNIPGLMSGEAIHGPLPEYYEILQNADTNLPPVVDDESLALRDRRDGTMKGNMAEVLNEMGIRHNDCQLCYITPSWGNQKGAGGAGAGAGGAGAGAGGCAAPGPSAPPAPGPVPPALPAPAPAPPAPYPTQTAQEDRTPAWVTVSQGIIYNINNQEIISPDSVTLPRVPPPHTTDAPLLVVIKGSHVGKLVRRIWNFKLDDRPWLILAVVQDGGIIGKEKLTGEKLEIQLDDLVCVRESAKAKKWGKQIIRPLWDEARRSGRKPEERFTISFAA